MLIISTGFFTSYPTGTVHHKILILFMIFKIFFYDIKRIPECINIWGYSSFEMPNFTLVVITHIYKNGIGIIDKFIEFYSINMHSLISHIKSGIVKPIGHDLIAHFNL